MHVRAPKAFGIKRPRAGLPRNLLFICWLVCTRFGYLLSLNRKKVYKQNVQ